MTLLTKAYQWSKPGSSWAALTAGIGVPEDSVSGTLLASGSHLWETLSEGKGACCEICFLVADGSSTDHLGLFSQSPVSALGGAKGIGGGKQRNGYLVHKLKNAYKYISYFSLFGEYYVALFTKIIGLLWKYRLKWYHARWNVIAISDQVAHTSFSGSLSTVPVSAKEWHVFIHL